MALHNLLGRDGENLASRHLQENGYRILERNWKLGDMETDIIAQKGDTIVFVEVKTRSGEQWKRPEQAVDEERKRRLTIGANAYLKHNKLDNPWRMDVIAIVKNEEGTTINHIEEAFTPRPHYITTGSMKPEKKWKTRERKR